MDDLDAIAERAARFADDIEQQAARIEQLEREVACDEQRVADLMEQVDRLGKENASLREERDDAVTANHSVSVCERHTNEITTHEGCVICDLIELRRDAENYRHLVPYFSVMSPDIDGMHYWVFRPYGLSMRGGTIHEAIANDMAAMKEAGK